MRRNLGCTVTAVVVLAVGIGPNTAIFSIVDKVLLRPLPYPHADRLLQLIVASPMGNATRASVAKYITWRQDRGAFELVAAFTAPEPLQLSAAAGPELASAVQVSADYFPLFGLQPALGRTFTRSEDVVRGPRVAVIGDGLWQRRFGRDRSIIGRLVQLDGESYEVIGVLAPDSTDAGRADVWLPLQADPDSMDHSSRLQVVARIRPGVTAEAARWQIYEAAGDFHRRFPRTMGPYEHFGVMPLREVVVGDARPALMFLLGAVTLVLLTACANVANLLLAQGTAREREFAVRASIGARPSTIIRQLLAECVLLASMGGALGVAMAFAGLQWLSWINPGYLSMLGPSMRTVSLDGRVLGFTSALLLLTTVLFGIHPAIRATRPNLAAMFGSGSTQATAGARHRRFGSALVVAQFACALVLVLGAGLLIQAFVSIRTTDPGFVSSQVLTLEMPIAGRRFAETAAVARVIETVENRLGALPDVVRAAASSSLPLEPAVTLPFAIDRRPLLRSPFHGTTNWRRVSWGYFDVFRIGLVAGRMLTRHDSEGGRPVALINESMARKFWPGDTPLEERITVAPSVRRDVTEPSRVIVGIVADVRESGLQHDVEPIVYVPIGQVSDGMNAFQNQTKPLQWMVRTSADPRRLSAAIQRELATSSGVPVGRVRTMDEVMRLSTARADFATTLLTVFAAIAVLLASVGLYGVMVQSIHQRRREIGVRMALGATPWSVRGLLLRQGLKLTAAGVAIGIVGSAALMQTMVATLFGLTPWSPPVFLGVAVLLSTVAAVAMLLAARRATGIHPATALT
jgi:predicted permease